MKEYWALILKYEPFTMGGDLWRRRRFLTLGRPVKIGKFSCFEAEVNGQRRVYHVETGSLLGHGKIAVEARSVARKNIATTPDLAKQMKAAGSVMTAEVISKAEALTLKDAL